MVGKDKRGMAAFMWLFVERFNLEVGVKCFKRRQGKVVMGDRKVGQRRCC